jgi:hypothetical protein
MRRREHRLDRWEARGRRGEALARPQRPDLVDGPAQLLDGGRRVVGDAHLLEPERQAGPDAHDDPLGEDLVEGRAGHRQHDRVAGEDVHGAEGHAEAIVGEHPPAGIRREPGSHGGGEGDRVALVVRVVDPQRIEARISSSAGPIDDIVEVAAGGEAEADLAGEGGHLAGSW